MAAPERRDRLTEPPESGGRRWSRRPAGSQREERHWAFGIGRRQTADAGGIALPGDVPHRAEARCHEEGPAIADGASHLPTIFSCFVPIGSRAAATGM